jgi:hypothetical protein
LARGQEKDGEAMKKLQKILLTLAEDSPEGETDLTATAAKALKFIELSGGCTLSELEKLMLGECNRGELVSILVALEDVGAIEEIGDSERYELPN